MKGCLLFRIAISSSTSLQLSLTHYSVYNVSSLISFPSFVCTGSYSFLCLVYMSWVVQPSSMIDFSSFSCPKTLRFIPNIYSFAEFTRVYWGVLFLITRMSTIFVVFLFSVYIHSCRFVFDTFLAMRFRLVALVRFSRLFPSLRLVSI